MTPPDYKEYADELLTRLADPSPVANVVVLEEVDSTQRVGREIQNVAFHDELALGVTAVVAWNQTEGRGRHGRPWWGDPGSGVLASLTHSCEAEQLALLPQAVSLAILQVVDRYCQSTPVLKWPNDLLVEGRKLGGVLIEALHRGRGPCHAIVGFGLNYQSLEETEQAEQSVALSECSSALPRLADLTAELLEAVVSTLRIGTSVTRSEIVAAYRSRLVHRPGDPLVCRVDGSELEGEFVGVDDDGHLRLRAGETEHVLAAAELTEPKSEGGTP